MNDHSALTDRVARHLVEAADQIRLQPGSERYVARTARRRRIRRHRLIASASVMAIGCATVVSVRELTSGGGQTVRTRPVKKPAVADTPSGSIPPASTGDPQLVWRTVEPDSATAVGSIVMARSSNTFPGVIVSTAPGRGSNPTPQLWRSDDGVSFTPVNSVPAGLSWSQTTTIGHTVYAFATAPGATAKEPSAMLGSVSTNDGDSWDDLVLPADTNTLASEFGISSVHRYVQGVAKAGDGTIALVGTVATPDLEALGIDKGTTSGFTPEGVTVRTDPNCELTATTISWPSGESPPATAAGPDTSSGSCATSLRTWSELGMSATAAAAVTGYDQQLLYAADGRHFVESSPPSTANQMMTLPNPTLPLVAATGADGTNHLYRFSDNGTWDELPTPPARIDTIAQLGDNLVALDAGPGPGLLAHTYDGTTWSSADIGALAGQTVGFGVAPGFGSGGLAVVVYATAPSDSTFTTVPETTTTVTVMSRGTTTAAPLPAPSNPLVPYVLHTLDGITWSVEPLADLLGTVDGQPSVRRIASVGNKLVIIVALDGTATNTAPPKQIALIGTPRG